ncbi:MAG: DUF202 domain-containing protein [Sporichthyaceae bacterium]
MPRPDLSGLPGERTLLAWDRTALALLANAALLIVRDGVDTPVLGLIAAGWAAGLAAVCAVLARTRAQRLARRGPGSPLPAASRALPLLAAGTVVLAALEAASILRA